ncbi:ATP-binding protein [Actinomadura rupiterrae]|uniref:ATP-binding protein n=1 Tax=Actinomadura rupiterrae TaxID=559627 RepID=UPI0020A4358C|nr:ATP-binding protein [Actinomadura rupiterrae]MCP2334819.1 anti-sigma regulatory factor (Ser/Thr protein kinase) [Actinomadura rupiterrae]
MITRSELRPTPPPTGVAELEVKSAPESIKAARDFVADWFANGSFDRDLVYVARTVVTELATNAHRHGSTKGDTITTRIFHTDAGPVIEVLDASAKLPTPKPLTLDGLTGRGLAMVDLMVSLWGYAPLPDGGKVVWALLRAHA